MRVLGIDPGTVVTGYGLLEENGAKLCLIEARGIRTSTKLSLPRRLRQIFEGIQGAIKDFEPDVVAVENTFLSKNFSSALKLGQACGVALLAAELSELEVYDYAPTEIKLAVTGHGAAGKPQVRQMLDHLVSMPSNVDAVVEDSHHAWDAVAVAVCHLHIRQVREKLRASEVSQ